MSNATMDTALLEGPLQLTSWPALETAGGECVFIGRTRLEMHPIHGELTALDYEAYRPMAERLLEELAHTAGTRWPCLAILVHHALGRVPIGEISVVVRVVCEHRNEAFEACRWLIDALKQQAPIWKKECWSDGTSWASGAAVKNPQESIS
ncbi:MAG: molybdenum cofactor biosynthesis protein MoaE [Phycisphaerales bacterium]|nr:molybdenum cofactor biosynthesis protein MoaE [Phycisphaerales bacterium]